MSAAAASRFAPERWPSWAQWWRRELAPFPGRDITTLRMVVTVVLVTIISITLQVPQLFFSAFFIFFVTKENRALTALTGMVFIVGATIAISTSILLSKFTFDNPEFRVPVTAAFVFVGMFLSRTLVLGPLGFVIGFLVALTQTITESAPTPEIAVRNLLWLWVALVYPIGLTVIINYVLLPAHPWDLLVTALELRLNATHKALTRMIEQGRAGGQTNPVLLDLATRGGMFMRALQASVEQKHPELRHRHAALLATVSAADHLARATAALEFRECVDLSPEDMACARALLEEVTLLQSTVKEREPTMMHRVPPPAATLPQLRELQFAVESFRDGLIRESSTETGPSTTVKPKHHIFIPGAFSNPVHTQFALKVTLAAMICYLIYSGLAWPGISTSFITCSFMALGTTGASLWKGWLRLTGCAIGGLFGYIAIIFFIPHMESITSLVLVTAVASALAGWVAAGSDRIAYGGLQAAFAFFLCLFQGFEPGTNFTLARDRLAGIFIGVIAFTLVFRLIWPEHAIDALRTSLVRVLRELAKLLQFPKMGAIAETDREMGGALRQDIIKDLDNTLRLSEFTVIEDAIIHNRTGIPPLVLEHLAAHTQALSLMSFILLGKSKVEEWERLDPAVQAAEAALRARAGEQLERIAAYVENGQIGPPPGLHTAYSAWNDLALHVSQNDRPRLMRRLMAQVRELQICTRVLHDS